ncbi:alpha/beta fold hydrolase [Burkholderia sp. FERM BP-3421]|uniref:alpha/beta fold hydrolase n=1 Tax=Burkholderia sp. FERM BP-3421 TaxID=1494466 RepID=UPI0023622D98|nr:alpha/beta fold hydrolase [Burkholderia sp. FERM BP-3421]WDD90803.1 alpha/beta fold hydrolase [Burkholderia sp. FERM BP-3421]
MTGAGAADAVGDPAYWVAQVGAPVDFHAALERLAADGVNLLIEIGPGATLTALARDTLAGRPVRAVSSLRRRGDDWTTLVGALGELYAAGATFDWREAGRIAPAARRACALPAYPFERRRHWLPAATASAARAGSETDAGPDEAHAHPLLGARLPTAALADGECLYQASPDPREVRDHRVYERIVMPGAAYVDLALRVASTLYPETPPALDALSISQALVFPPARRTVLQTLATRRGDGGHDLRVFSRRADEPGAGWRAHAGARLGAPCAPVANPDLGALRASFDASGETLPVDAFYADYAALGLAYGPGYRCVRALSRRADARAVLARIAADVAPDPGYLLAPPLLDGCFQAVGAIVGAPGGETAYLPVSIERVWAPRATPAAFWCHATLRAPRDDAPARVVADLRLIADDGGLIAAIDGLEAVPVERRALQFATADWRDLLYEVNWQTRPARAAELPPVAAHGGWLVLGDAAAAAAAAQFEARGAQVVRVGAAEAEGMTCGDWRQLFALRFDAAGVPFAGVVHLSAADAAEAGAPAALADPALGAGALLLAQALAERATAAGPRLWFVTRGAQRVDEQGPTHPAHALLWGFARSVALECPALACACVDLPPGETGLPPGFADDLLAPDAEPSSAYRQGRRSVARLGPLKASPFRPGLARPAGPFRLRALRYGGLDALALLGCARPAPGPGEVEIEVQAGAVNFKDVLFSLGMLQAFSEGRGIRRALDQPLGFECAGRIARLGAGVTGFAPGDVVFAMAPSALAAYVNADARLVRPVPRGLTPAEAAALPTVFMTAIHALERLARVRPGERVLVHACAGGVGQAALQIARRAGATVYGTASPSKWAALKAQGVAHVMHSRTLDFADELRRVTDGRGVDVVLNSLGGAFIPRSADVLAPGGRFVEIGKIDIWDAARMQAYRPDIAYAAFDLGELDDTAGGLQADLLDAVAHGFEAGELRPLPVRTFPIAQAEAAFRHLAQARQVGKVVLDLAAAPDTARPVRADRRYLVTGGFGALGRRLVARLADEGARDLVVAGRRADPAALDAWRTRYPAVRFEALEMDVTDAASVAAGFRRIDADGPPLGGVVHAAGALDDATLANLDWARFARVLAPKLAGAWHLHEATAARALDWFVLFSSIASVTGAPGQANYAAANACVDALARYRHAQGLPATCIGWGPWDDAGMAERARDANRARFDALGVARLPAGDALDVFAFLLGADTHAVVADVAWPRFLGSLPTTGDAPFYALLGRRAASAAAREDGALAKQLRAAPADARAGLVATALRALLADVTGGAAELIDLGQPLRELGIDSLMVVELNHRLEARLGCKLGPKLLVEQPTLEGLAARLAGLALGEGGRGEAGAVAGHDAADGQGARAAGQPADAQDAPGARDLPGEHDPTAGRDRAEARGARLPAAPREPAPAPLASMSDTRLDLDGRRIGLCRWGSAVAPMQIVCVHGILDQGAIWAPFAQALAATGVGVVAPDLRGHGPLGAPPGAPPPSMAEFVADLLAVLDHVAGAGRRVVLAGHSLGSIAAALGAALRPGAIAHLVLVEPVAPSLREAADPVERLAQDLRYLTDAPAHPVYPDLASAARMLLLRHPALDASLAEALARRIARDVAGGVSWRWDARLRNPLGVDPQCSQADYLAVLGRLAMPSTRFYGRASEFAGTPVLVAPDLALPRGASVTLDGGHNLHTDAAARLADAVSALCHDLERG